jgi:hypothetical protein
MPHTVRIDVDSGSAAVELKPKENVALPSVSQTRSAVRTAGSPIKSGVAAAVKVVQKKPSDSEEQDKETSSILPAPMPQQRTSVKQKRNSNAPANIDAFRVTYNDNSFPKTVEQSQRELAATKAKAVLDEQKTRTIGHYVVGKWREHPWLGLREL